MVHSQLPVLSLLCLFRAPLLLSQGMFLDEYTKFSLVTPKDAGLQKALAFALPQYNKKRTDDANYFKMLTVIALSKVYKGREYHIKASFLKTVCKKTTSKTMTFKEIQKCKEHPGNPQKQFCYLKVIRGPIRSDRNLTIVHCT